MNFSIKTISVLLLCFILVACVESKIQSFTDPDYKEVKFTNVLVNLNSLPISSRLKVEKIVIQRLNEAGYKAILISDVLPPTREYANDEAISIVSNSGVEYMLAINVLEDTASTSLVGFNTYTYGNVYAVGNQAYANANANTVTTPVVDAKGETSIQATMFDVKNGHKAWVASVATEASGTLFVGNVDSIANSAIGKIIDQIKADGHN
jgi:hypothetical protein